jgi:hypothetical protein
VIVPPGDKEYRFIRFEENGFTLFIEEHFLPVGNESELQFYIPNLGEASLFWYESNESVVK